MYSFFFLSWLSVTAECQISCLSLDCTWISMKCEMINTMYHVWSSFEKNFSSELLHQRKFICSELIIWQDFSAWCATNKVILTLKFDSSILLLNFCCQVSRSSADDKIKMSSYTDFRFDVDLLSMHEQEKKYCFFIFFLEKHLMIEDCEISSVSVSRCFSSFLVWDSLTSSHANSNNWFNTHSVSADMICSFSSQYQHFFYITSESELLIFSKLISSSQIFSLIDDQICISCHHTRYVW